MNRPKRVFRNSKNGKLYYLVKGRKRYIKLPPNMSQKQFLTVNIQNRLGYKRNKRKNTNPTQKVSNIVLTKRLYEDDNIPIKNGMFKNTVQNVLQDIPKQLEIKPLPLKQEHKVYSNVAELQNNPDTATVYIGDYVHDTPPANTKKNLDKEFHDELIKDNKVRARTSQLISKMDKKQLYALNDFVKSQKPSAIKNNFYSYTNDDELRNNLISSDYFNDMSDETVKKVLKNSQIGGGYHVIKDDKYNFNDKNGMTIEEVYECLKNKTNKIIPVITVSQIPELSVNPKEDLPFIMLEKEHFIAIYIDISSHSIEYYDPLAQVPSKTFLKNIKKVIDKFHSNIYFLLKINQIREQNFSSSECGRFCIRFLFNRLNGKSFKESTYFNNIDKSKIEEQKIKKFNLYL